MSFVEKASTFFDEADTSGEGKVDRMELCKICQKCGSKDSVEDISSWFDDIDKNDDNILSKEEFLEALNRRDPKEVKECEYRAVFQEIDTDGSGAITMDELKQVLGDAGDDPDHPGLGSLDANDDGKINFEEFLALFRQ